MPKSKASQPPPERWRIPSAHNQKLDKDSAMFIIGQGEKLLNDLSRIASDLAARSLNIVLMTTGILVAMVGYGISEWTSSPLWSNTLITVVMGTTYLAFVLAYISRNIQPFEYANAGSPPKPLCEDERYFTPTVSDGQRIELLLASEIANYQWRIDENSETNTKRWKIYKWSIYALLALPPILLTVYVLCEAIR